MEHLDFFKNISYENGGYFLLLCTVAILSMRFVFKKIIAPLCLYIFKRHIKKNSEEVPSISFYIHPTPNLKEYVNGLSIVNLTKDKNTAVYVKCSIMNNGNCNITLVKICNHRLQCPLLKPQDEYLFSIKMKPKNNNIKVILQNELNETFEGSYILLYRPKSNRTNIEIQHKFKKKRMFNTFQVAINSSLITYIKSKFRTNTKH